MTRRALVLAAVDAIGQVIWSSMLEVLLAEGGAEGRCRRSVAGAREMAGSDERGDRGWRQGCDGLELSGPIDGIGPDCLSETRSACSWEADISGITRSVTCLVSAPPKPTS